MIETTFIFDGQKSIDYGLNIVSIDSGMRNVAWIGAKSIVEEKVPKKDIAYFKRVDKSPIEFELTFSLLEEKMTDKKKFEIARWLFHDEYKPIEFTGNLNCIFYVIATNQVDFVTSDNELGYFQISFRTNAPYAWSHFYGESFNVKNGDIIEVENKSNVYKYYKPEIEFITNTSTFGLTNLSNGGTKFEFTDLDINEKIYVNNDMKRIITDKLDTHRLGNFNKNWLSLSYGKNRLLVNGEGSVKFRCQYPLYL